MVERRSAGWTIAARIELASELRPQGITGRAEKRSGA